MTPRIPRMTPRIRTMSDLFVGCAATDADFAVPGVASSSGARGCGWRRRFFGCLGLGWLLAFVVMHDVSILSGVFAGASVCACLVPL
jgi:hypothetical protein